MTVLRVRYDDRVIDFAGDEPVGLGRTAARVGETVGWGYPGRFVELGADPSIHRVWCDLVPFDQSWVVRSLGSLNPVVVAQASRTHRLEPFGATRRDAGLSPDSLSITAGSFELDMQVGQIAIRVPCEIMGEDSALAVVVSPALGSTTTNMGSQLADDITQIEYRVLWAMGLDRRERRGEDPASYTRIVRLLSLDSKRQAVAAVERLTKRFRDVDLIPPGTPSQMQRRVICERAEELGLLERLEERFGSPV